MSDTVNFDAKLLIEKLLSVYDTVNIGSLFKRKLLSMYDTVNIGAGLFSEIAKGMKKENIEIGRKKGITLFSRISVIGILDYV